MTVKTKYRLGNFVKKTVTNNVAPRSFGSGDPMLWQLTGERVMNHKLHWQKLLV